MTLPLDNRAVLRELIELWESHDNEPHAAVRGDFHHVGVPVAVRGLVAHAVDCARAVLTLYSARQPVPAIPLVRVVMEDAVTAAWLIVEPNAWRSFITDGARQKQIALREILGFDDDGEITKLRLEEMTKILDDFGSPTGHKVEQRIQRLAGSERMYLTYRLASAMTHAGLTVADLYTATDDSSEIGVAFRPYPDNSLAATWIGLAATNLTLAMLAWDMAVAERPDRAALESIADRIGVRKTIELKQK